MKKALCLLLTACFAFLLTLPGFCSSEGLTAVFSPVTGGEITVTVTSDAVKNLTAASFELLYNTDVYELASASECTYQADGETLQSFPGIWQLGKKSDGSGAAAVFISALQNGTTKAQPTEMCRFVLRVKNGYSDNTGIDFYIKELCTNDGNFRNDIYEKTLVGHTEYTFTDADRFSFAEGDGGTLSITKYNFFEKSVNIPEKINGQTVSAIKENAFSDDGAVFIFIPQSVTAIEDGALCEPEGRMIFTCEGSAATDYADKNGIAYAAVLSGSRFLFDGSIIRTEECFCTEPRFFVLGGEAECEIISSHSTEYSDYFGTGSIASFACGGETLSFTLAVTGDLNGDSVPDALDLSLAELCCSGHVEPDGVLLAALDVNCSGAADEADYSALVNSALSFDGSSIFNK